MGSGRKSRSSVVEVVLKYGAPALAGGFLGHAYNAPRINDLERRLDAACAAIAARDRSLERARAKEAQKDDEIAKLRGVVIAKTREIELSKAREAQKDEEIAKLRGVVIARTREIELSKAKQPEQPTTV